MKIYSLEAFRGLLALWVVIGHTIKHSGYDLNRLGIFKPLGNPGQAVDCFIMLSGFVIFFLLDSRRISYQKFIAQRFFRLGPIYLVVLVISALTIGWQTSLLEAYPWKSITVSRDLTLHTNAISHLVTQFVVHLTMLHGLVADNILSGSQYAIVGQAWSISVEWQFYLIAPLLFAMVKQGRWRALACTLLVLCGLRAWNYGGEGFAVNQGAHFLVGILSYYVWKRFATAPGMRPELIEAGAVLVITFAYLVLPRSLPLIIWATMMGVAFMETSQLRQGVFAKMGKVLLATPLQFLGRISYSVYMVHMLVFYAAASLFPILEPGIDKPQYLILNILGVVSVTVLLSAVCYRVIEVPGMKLGRRLTERMAVKPRKTADDPVHGAIAE